MLTIINNKFVETRPFKWLGDTAWRMFKILEAEMRAYLQDRKNKGFTVIQGPNLDEGTNEQNDLAVRLVREYGFYQALVPMWTNKANSMTEAQLDAKGKELAQRYPFDNILWLVLGEGTPVARAKVNAIANAIKSLNPHQLMTIHPTGWSPDKSTSKDFDSEPWLDFHMVHSGHDLSIWNEPLIQQVIGFGKPVIVGEDVYEDIHNKLNNANPRITAEQVLARASYVMLFSEACGYTYGANGVWQFYKGEADNPYNARYQWQEALNLEGAKRIKELL